MAVAAERFKFILTAKDQSPLLQKAEDLGKQLDLAVLSRASNAPPETTGFLVSGYDKEKFRAALVKGSFLISCLDGNRLAGYVFACDGSLFQSRHLQTTLAWFPSPEAEKAKLEFEKKAFTYIDQIAVHPDYHGAGVALNLLRQVVLHSVNKNFLLALVLRSPAHNVRSEAFFKKSGYEILGEASTPRIHQVSNVRASMFVKLDRGI